MSYPIRYKIKPSNPYAHLYTVTLEIDHPDPEGQLLRMPAWIPGSYMLREFAKNVVEIRAKTRTGPLTVRKVDKSTWKLDGAEGPVCVTYSVYAWDESVRSAHLDQTHAYFNGTSVFMEVVGQAESPCGVEIQNADIAEAARWRVATTLQEDGAERYGFGQYRAGDYEDLVDHPVEIADFTLGTFEACGIPHELVITGKHYADVERICNDLKPICEHHIRFFGEPAPMSRYLFLTWVVGDGYGGLEHRSSTSLICKRDDLPNKNTGPDISEDYQNFLGLCSHEYFHTWNVKRIRPAVFIPYNLSTETHTDLLWAFEGITSYYDDLGVYRAGLISEEQFLNFLAKTYTRVFRGAGRLIQSCAESSFDTWTKFYKQDENAINAIVSYYTKGSLAILAMDLKLRELTGHQRSFDDVMARLWQDYQDQTRDGGKPRGVREGDIENIIVSLLETDQQKGAMSALIQQLLYGTEDVDFGPLFASVGLSLKERPRSRWTDSGGKPPGDKDQITPWTGAMFTPDPSGAKILNVATGKAASLAGLSAGDVIVAVDGIKASADRIETLFQPFAEGDEVKVHAFRKDLLMEFTLTVDRAPDDTVYFVVEDENKLKAWLKGVS
ncbi:MAG: PDZ domain-containing protein [Ketobacteraceae bacterium]|nr:PDZ domain-containing protein [Ketobacteraceae bacterium]